ncbi:helix-turn-helix DNA binding domain protein [Rhodobacter phage RcCWillis]|nr:helix-turn-helix DNA binding domain protein [Rhodobacter phage RcCWillis]
MKLDLREQAERFAVWRMGTNSNWECTYGEVAEKTGVPLPRVMRICLANNWRFVEDDDFQPVDFLMHPTSAVDVNHFHV